MLDQNTATLIAHIGRRTGVEDGILTLAYAMRATKFGSPQYMLLWAKVCELLGRLEAEYGPPPALLDKPK